MTAPLRRGACPALSAPMRTGDGLIARLSPVGGAVTPGQFAALCDAAETFGNGILEITARGNLQFRGLSQDSAPRLADTVNALGITARTGVPVETGPLAGLDPLETLDPRPLAEAIRQAIAATDLASRLGPKVSVVVDGGGQVGMDDLRADIRFRAAANGTVRGWVVALDGHESRQFFIKNDFKNNAVQITLNVLNEISRIGPAAHLRDVPSKLLKNILEAFPALTESRPESPPIGPIGALTLHDRLALGIGLAFGQASAASLRRLAALATEHGATEMRFSPGRALLILGLDEDGVRALRRPADALGFVTAADDPRRSVAACAGAPACASGHIASRALAGELAVFAGPLLDGSLDIHVSGCAKGCAHPAASVITLIGDAKGCGLVVDGTATDRPLAHLAEDDVREAIARLGDLFGKSRLPGENAASCLRRLGVASLSSTFAREQ